MSLRIHVDTYDGYRADERPRRFELDGVGYRIYAWEREWRESDFRYFLMRAAGERCILRYNEREDEWTLQSGLDGAELFARPNASVVTVGPEAIAKALSQISGCQRGRGDEAQLFFDHVLADALAMRGSEVEVLG